MTKKMIRAVVLMTMMMITAASSINPTSAFASAADVIKVSAPAAAAGKVTIAGTSSLAKVYMAIKAPSGEIAVYPVDVKNGSFAKQVWLRYGKGSYSVWLGQNASKFDGTVRIAVANTVVANEFTAPSGYVDSDNPAIVAIAASITKPGMNDATKVKAVHDWVAGHIAYDYAGYLAGKTEVNKASDIIAESEGICRDYSVAFAAIARAAGVSTKVVYGTVTTAKGWAPQKHAWNEVRINGAWLPVDTTFDAGYIKNGKFVASLKNTYAVMTSKDFAKTHKTQKVAVL